MGLIDIDDRDIINNYPPCLIDDTPTKDGFDIIKNILQNEFGDCKLEHFGKGYFKLDFPATINTGSDITRYFSIPFKHKMHRVEFKHTDSSYADSTNALTYTLKYGSTFNVNLLFSFITKTASTASDVAHMLDSFWRAPSRYQLMMNTTNTELVYVSLLFEIEDEPHRG